MKKAIIKAWVVAITAAIFMSASLLSGCGSDNSARNKDSSRPAPQTRAWQPVGGNATVSFKKDLTFLQFIPDLDLASAPSVSQGRELFVADWTPAPGTRSLLDGLGPLFIADACSDCHLASGRAPSLNQDGTTSHGILFRLGTETGQPDSHFGGQLQTSATLGSPEAEVTWQDIGLGRPQFQLSGNERDLDTGVNLGPRLSPQLTGVGLLELVPEGQILERHDPDDQNQDGISGRAHRVKREGAECLGRFG